MKLCIDIDGVLRDMLTPMVNVYNKKYGTKLTCEDITDYDVTKSFPKLVEDGLDPFKFFFTTHSLETMTLADECPNAAEALSILKLKGHQIIIVSYQPTQDAKNRTIEWLQRHDMIYDKLIFTDVPSKKSISDTCELIIDDRPEYLNETTASPICIDYAYNRGYKYSRRYRGLIDFALLVPDNKKIS